MTSTNTRMQARSLANLTTDPMRAREKMLEAAKVNIKLIFKTLIFSGVEYLPATGR